MSAVTSRPTLRVLGASFAVLTPIMLVGCASTRAISNSERDVPASHLGADRCGERVRTWTMPAPETTPSGSIVAIRRPRGIGDLQAYALSVNGTFVSWLCPDELVRLAVPPGKHLVRVGCSGGWSVGRSWTGLNVDARAGVDEYVEPGPGDICARVVAVPRAEGDAWRLGADPAWVPAAVASNLGRVAVIVKDAPIEVSVLTPPKGKAGAAVTGATTGALIGLFGGASALTPANPAAGFALGLVLAPVGAVVGAIQEARVAEPADVVESREASVRAALEITKLLQRLRDGLTAAGGDASTGSDSILELSLTQFRLGRPRQSDRSEDLFPRGGNRLEISLTIGVRLLRAADGAERIAPRTFEVVSVEQQQLEAWAKHDARAFREALPVLADRAAGLIAGQVFGRP
jgi:hypothetical protein